MPEYVARCVRGNGYDDLVFFTLPAGTKRDAIWDAAKDAMQAKYWHRNVTTYEVFSETA